MKAVWKYEIVVDDSVRLEMPAGAKILAVSAAQAPAAPGRFNLWAEVDPYADNEHRYLHVWGTGHPMPGDDPSTYVGTVFCANGALVWHVYEDPR